MQFRDILVYWSRNTHDSVVSKIKLPISCKGCLIEEVISLILLLRMITYPCFLMLIQWSSLIRLAIFVLAYSIYHPSSLYGHEPYVVHYLARN
jgi:hypothetical protein